ncbi:hypothetical protein [Actinomadura rupiterrae]|uniref:hypothetical protein n=1 Tax=Actinomadura rupiterrae TaxID=559627 RepID=UPI0020A5C506|nr:hypothetical protein [Actinomadura rupiterrae]MCP2341690.1 hypothetical protein [Actinomadura rupiterrae]
MIPDGNLLGRWLDALSSQLELPPEVTLKAGTWENGSDFPDERYPCAILADSSDQTVCVFVGGDPTAEDALVRLAGELQDDLAMRSWGTPVPQCPGHPHPLRPTTVQGAAVWTCPQDPERHTHPIL